MAGDDPIPRRPIGGGRQEEPAPAGRGLRRVPLFVWATAAAVTVGVAGAIRIRWVCDDAFITFRYIQNLLEGNGLVYNAGERVEGYTHLLWLLLVALFRWLGFEPVAITQVLGLLAYAGTLLVFALASWRLFGGGRLLIPITSLALALHFDFRVWATGGLETALFTFLVAAAYYVIAIPSSRSVRSCVLSGLLLALAVLTRPDGIIFLLILLGFLALREGLDGGWRAAARAAALFLVPVVGLLLPWLAWKSIYYGSILPNTYYAKSAGIPYYSQGFFYLWLYFRAYLSTAAVLFGIVMLLAFSRQGLRSLVQGRASGAALLAIALATGYLLLFVARVGDDFMYARFLHPVIPFFYFGAEIGLQNLLRRRRGTLLVVTAVLLVLIVHERSRRDALFINEDGSRKGSYGVRGITDEHWYWGSRDDRPSLIERYRQVGEQLARYFDGETVRVLLGGQASLGYYARFPVCIEYAGLTDRVIARQPLAKRGRPGHEKAPSREYLIGRGVHFVFMKAPFEQASYRFAYLRIGTEQIRGEMFTYDRGLMGHLRVRFPDDVRFIDFEEYLDRWLERMPEMPREEVARAYAEFRDFYFRHNPDREREGRILSFLRRTR